MVSIIVPIYNVEQYITACLKSVEAQTYSDYEVILVDDCGTDGSMKIVEDFVNRSGSDIRKHGKYKIVRHEKNRGLSAARNTGTAVAKGKYVYYLDSDDTITPDCLERLVTEAERTEAEMVVGNIHVIGAPEGIPTLRKRDTLCDDNVFNAYLNGLYYLMAWNKLVQRDFLERNQITFVEGIIHEDEAWSFSVALFLKKVAIVYDKTYNYYIRANSIMTGPDSTKHFNAFSTLLKYYVEEASKNNKIDDAVFRWWYEGVKFDYFSRILSCGTNKQLHDIYTIIRQNFPMRGWRRTTIHYYLPSCLGIMVYRMAVYVKLLEKFWQKTV